MTGLLLSGQVFLQTEDHKKTLLEMKSGRYCSDSMPERVGVVPAARFRGRGWDGRRRCETMDLQVKDKRISWICKAQGFIELHNANPDLYNDAVSQTTTSSVAIFFVCFICIPVLCIGEDWDTI